MEEIILKLMLLYFAVFIPIYFVWQAFKEENRKQW